jgi:hypothetical protein
MATVTREWVAQNLEAYKALLDRKPLECPICYETFSDRKQAASPLLSDIPSKCTHWLCKDCWESIASHDAECPFCREDLRTWLLRTCNEKLTNQEVQKFLVSVMCIQGGSQPILTDDAMFDISHRLYNHNFD